MPRSALALVPAVVLLATAVTVSMDARQAGTAEAWEASTARYLDARMELWWANAKQLKTADGETRCLSCHTAVPYALVRPALRQTQGIATPTPHEARVLDTVRRRIAAGAAVQPYYDQNDAKQRESRGVEAVLNALVVALVAADMSAGDREALARAAFSRLWDVQRGDGAWDWLDFGLEPYEAPDAVFHGATVAALAIGSDVGMKAGEDARGREGSEQQWLRSHRVPGTVDDASWAPWRAYSLNHDREHGGPRGEPWRRMFMSDLATAFASLALL